MPILSISGDLVPRKKRKSSNGKKNRNLSGISPTRIIKPARNKSKQIKKNPITEEVAKQIFEKQDVAKLRSMFKE